MNGLAASRPAATISSVGAVAPPATSWIARSVASASTIITATSPVVSAPTTRPATTMSKVASSSGEWDGKATHWPSTSATRVAPTGPENGRPDSWVDIDAALIASTSYRWSGCSDMTVMTTWTSLRRPLTKVGRSGRSISRQVRIASSLGRPSRRKNEPGMRPAAYIRSSTSTVSGKKSRCSFGCFEAVVADRSMVSSSRYATAAPAACLASRPVSKRMVRVPKRPLSMVATASWIVLSDTSGALFLASSRSGYGGGRVRLAGLRWERPGSLRIPGATTEDRRRADVLPAPDTPARSLCPYGRSPYEEGSSPVRATPLSCVLPAQAESLDQRPVAGDIGLGEVLQQAAAAADEQQQPAPAVVIVLVRAQMLGQVRDPSRQHRHLDLGRTRVTVGGRVVRHDLLLHVAGQSHAVSLAIPGVCRRSSSRRQTSHRTCGACRPGYQPYPGRCPTPTLGRFSRSPTATKTGAVRSVQQAPRLLHVPAHLLDQVLDAVELLHPADPLDELDAQLDAVDVGVEVEDEGLHGALAALEGRVRADRDRRRQPAPVQHRPARVDPVGRDRDVPLGAHVGGGVAQLPAAALAAHDDAVDPVRPAQHLGRLAHLTGVDAGADQRRGQRHVVVPQHRHPLGGKPEPPAKGTQLLQVTGRLVTEAEVLPHHHGGRVQLLHHHDVHELGRAQPAELGAEGQHAQHVDAELRHDVGLAAQFGQHRRVGAGTDHLARVRVEGQHHRRQAALPGALHRPPDELLVTAVDAVEDADGHHAATPPRRCVVEATPALHRTLRSVPGRAGLTEPNRRHSMSPRVASGLAALPAMLTPPSAHGAHRFASGLAPLLSRCAPCDAHSPVDSRSSCVRLRTRSAPRSLRSLRCSLPRRLTVVMCSPPDSLRSSVAALPAMLTPPSTHGRHVFASGLAPLLGRCAPSDAPSPVGSPVPLGSPPDSLRSSVAGAPCDAHSPVGSRCGPEHHLGPGHPVPLGQQRHRPAAG